MPRVPIAAPVIVATTPSMALAALERAVHAGNLDSVMAWYTDDAVLLPPDESQVVGKEAIRSRYIDLFAHTKLSARFEVDEERVMGVIGSVRGRMVGTRGVTTRASEDQSGKFVMLFRKERGRWLIATLIWNADR